MNQYILCPRFQMNEGVFKQANRNKTIRTEGREIWTNNPNTYHLFFGVCAAKVKVVSIWGVWTALSTFCPLEVFAAEGSDAGAKTRSLFQYYVRIVSIIRFRPPSKKTGQNK